MEKNGNKNAIRGDLTRGFEFLKYQVKRVTSCELLEEKQFFLTILNRLQFLSFEPCLKISLIVILLSYSHEHNICIKFIFATMYINFIILTAEWKCKGDHRSSRRSLRICEGKHENLRPAWIRTVHDLYDIVTALFASTSCIFNCAMIPFAFISSPLGSNIYHFISIFPRQYITNHFNDQLPVGLISSID